MLSDHLNSLAEHFGRWEQAGGVKVDARLCGVLRTNLTDARDQARRMEGTPVPPAAMSLPPGVARLDDYRPIGGRAA